MDPGLGVDLLEDVGPKVHVAACRDGDEEGEVVAWCEGEGLGGSIEGEWVGGGDVLGEEGGGDERGGERDDECKTKEG